MEYVKEVHNALGINFLQYDATIGELEGFKDAKKLPEEFEGEIFTKNRMVAIETTLSNQVTHGSVRFLDDAGQTNQMTSGQ